MRATLPDGTNVEGSPSEIAELLGTLRAVTPSAVGNAAVAIVLPAPPAPQRRVPHNEELLAEYRDVGGVSRETRGGYVRAVEEFERIISPKSFVDATVDDVLRFERALTNVCAHRKANYLAGRGKLTVVPKLQCQKGEYAWTLTPPDSCATSCPLFERQSNGPKARLGGLAHFYNWLLLRGLVTTNVVQPVQREHARAAPQREERGKYAPTTEEVRAIVRALTVVGTPRDVALILILAKTGRRPGHVTELGAEDLHLDAGGVSWVSFRGVRERVRRENGHTRTKLRGDLHSILDAELVAYLVDVYLPYRQARWGYAWNEGPLFPGTQSGEALNEKTIQRYVLDPALKHLETIDAAKWRAHQDDDEVRITPGVFRHWFTSQLKRAGVDNQDIDLLRGDKVPAARMNYMDLKPADLAQLGILRLPRLLGE